MKRILFAILLLAFIQACKTSGGDFTVNGTVKNMGNGEIFFIKSSDDNKIDTVKVNNDAFTFKGMVTVPTVYMINFGADQQPAFAIIDKGENKIEFTMDSYNSFHATGGKDQELYNKFVALVMPFYKQIDSLGQIANANQDNKEMMQVLQSEYFKINDNILNQQKQFIKDNPKSVASAFIAANYLNEKMDKTAEEIQTIFNSLDPSIQSSFFGKKINEMGDKLKGTSVGKPASDFTLNDVNDKPVSLSSFKGKVTLIDFWASWCGPCRAENPNVVNAYAKYHDKGLEILGVSLDDQKDKWMSAIEKDHLTWTHVSDLKGWNSTAATLYGIQSIPANFLLDSQGVIIAKDLRGEDLERKLAEVLK